MCIPEKALDLELKKMKNKKPHSSCRALGQGSGGKCINVGVPETVHYAQLWHLVFSLDEPSFIEEGSSVRSVCSSFITISTS
jgi:hypothetical protein